MCCSAEPLSSQPLASIEDHLGFTIDDLARLRPFAYHSSGRENFSAIQRRGRLRSAKSILAGFGHEELLTTRRPLSVTLELDGETVVIRDNRPLAPGSLQLLAGWSLSDWLMELNSRVFLWPGNEEGPIGRGRSHFQRYESEGEVFTIRVPTISLVRANRERQLWVTRCNSGSARHHGGKPVPRGPSTFQLPEEAEFRPSQVIELSYVAEATLPPDTEWSQAFSEPWNTLWDAG